MDVIYLVYFPLRGDRANHAGRERFAVCLRCYTWHLRRVELFVSPGLLMRLVPSPPLFFSFFLFLLHRLAPGCG